MIAPARTGSERRSKIAVIKTDQTNKGMRSKVNPLDRILIIVVIKFTAPKIDLTPAKWREKIARSTDAPVWAITLERGGYTVHPVPAPVLTKLLESNKDKEGGRSQKLILFIRGKAISGAPSINGTNQFPNPPIIIGIIIKKIIINAWAVTITLYVWSSSRNNPGCPNSKRINTLNLEPIIPDQIPNKKYKVPISLWFVDSNHLLMRWLIIGNKL